MADQQPKAAADQPVPGQVQPQPADVVRPPATAQAAAPAQPEQPEETPRDKAARLRREAAEIEASLPAQADEVRVKVEEPHSEFHFGGTFLSNEFTPVSAMRLAGIQEAAAAAGVKLTTE